MGRFNMSASASKADCQKRTFSKQKRPAEAGLNHEVQGG
jgi:hypothetical protein